MRDSSLRLRDRSMYRSKKRKPKKKKFKAPKVTRLNDLKELRNRQSFNTTGFYASQEWLSVRYRALVLNGRQCKACGSSGLNIRLHVDHIKPRSKYPHLELDLNNLQVLCEACNLGKSNKDETDWRG